LESGAPDDAINVENFCKKARVSDARPFKIVRTRDEVDMQWARAAVSAGLPMSFFDNKEVRKAVRMTAECGENYIRTKPGGVKETTLPHRTYFTTKLIPKLDKFIDAKNMGKMREMAEDVLSDTCLCPPSLHPYVVTMVLFTGAPGFCKQVGSFPRSRYDRGLQASSRILPT
jgi:hypothetical protein